MLLSPLLAQNGWKLQYSGTPANLHDLFFVSKYKGWCVGDKGILMSTTNAGTLWHLEQYKDQKNLNGIFFIDSLTGWIVGNAGTVLKTSDGGNNWNKITTSFSTDLIKVFFVDKNTGWAIGKYDILKTTDGGITWFFQLSIKILKFPYLNDIFFIDKDHGWAVGRSAAYTTTNGGQNWSTDSTLLGYNYSIYFWNKNDGMICRNSGSRQTSDGGKTWVSPFIPFPYSQEYYQFKDISYTKDNTGYMLSYSYNNNDYPYISCDNGITWLSQNIVYNNLYPTVINQIFGIDKKTAFCVGDNGVIYHYENNGIHNGLTVLNANNISTVVNPDNTIGADFSTWKTNFIAPKEGSTGTIFASCLWIGGYDEGENLHIAAQTYHQGNSFDFWAGPLDTTDAYPSYPNDWQHVWNIEKSTILNHISNWNKSGYSIPEDIATWPANGTGLHSRNLAPFVDLNHNNIYEPAKGEYPFILGDQAAYSICNDNYADHTETNSLKLGIEMHSMAYEFWAPWIEPLNNTVFVKYRIINRSRTDYKKVYAGIWTDFDIGYAYDDYVGCDSMRSMYFGYNADSFDESAIGYGAKPPVQAVVFLSDTMSNFIYYNNDFSRNGNPEKATDYYFYLTSRFKDGRQMRYGGDGYFNIWDAYRNSNYMFSGNPRKGKPEWSEYTSKNTSGDRRGLGSIGPFDFKAGDVKEIVVAYVFAQSDTGGNLGSYNKLLNSVDVIRDLYNRDLITSVNEPGLNTDPENNLLVYPNPASGIVKIRFANTSAKFYSVLISDISGKTLIENNRIKTTETSYATDQFAKGIYIITVKSDNLIVQKKLIVN
jgi:photosystem II stability/assembly factor-like uncharacterized protein